MKLNIKGLLIIFILLNASQISLTMNISHSYLKVKLANKKTSKNNKSTTTSKANLNTFRRSNTSNKLVWDDWTNLDLLLPIAFLKGLCSEISVLSFLVQYLELILTNDLKKFAQNFACKNLSTEALNKVMGDPSKFIETAGGLKPATKITTESLAKSDLKTFTTDVKSYSTKQLKLFITDIWNNSFTSTTKEEEKNEEEAIKNIEVSKDSACKTVEKIDTTKTDDVLKYITDNNEAIKVEVTKEKSTDEKFHFIVKVYTQFSNLETKINNLNKDLAQEVENVHLDCLKEDSEEKILNFSDAVKKADVKVPETKRDFELDFYELKVISDIDLNDKINETYKSQNNCKQVLLDYYNKKVSNKTDIETQKASCIKRRRKGGKVEEASQNGFKELLSKLFKFTLNFIKEVAKCVVISFITGLLVKGIMFLFGLIANLLSAGAVMALKVLWYFGNMCYYLISAYRIDDEKEKDNAKLTKAKRTKAEKYGSATANLIKMILSVLNLSKKKFNKFMMRRKLSKK